MTPKTIKLIKTYNYANNNIKKMKKKILFTFMATK